MWAVSSLNLKLKSKNLACSLTVLTDQSWRAEEKSLILSILGKRLKQPDIKRCSLPFPEYSPLTPNFTCKTGYDYIHHLISKASGRYKITIHEHFPLCSSKSDQNEKSPLRKAWLNYIFFSCNYKRSTRKPHPFFLSRERNQWCDNKGWPHYASKSQTRCTQFIINIQRTKKERAGLP